MKQSSGESVVRKHKVVVCRMADEEDKEDKSRTEDQLVEAERG